ncbi:MAG: FAD-binding oxidoreductase [Rhodobacteraceae bacterium]|nr:FAD-binding oxidoreductase [Paracoccaceae bacterium]
MIRSVAIVGGGILGAALAHAAASQGLQVTLIDAGPIGGGTTGASFGWVNASTKVGDKTYHDLNAAGVRAWHRLYDQYGADIGMTPTGSVQIVAGDDAQGITDLTRDAARLSGFGYDSQEMSAQDLGQIFPYLALPPAALGLHCAQDAVIDGPKAARWFAGRARDLGAAILDHCPARAFLMTEDGTVSGIATDQVDIHADAVVLCTGKNSGDTLADLAGYDGFRNRFPLRQVPGLILQTPPMPEHLRPSQIIWTSVTEEFHMMPTADGGLRMGSDDFDRFATEDGLQIGAQHLIDRTDLWLPGIKSAVTPQACTLLIGIRPYPTDGHSIFGPIPGVPNAYLMATHSGITLAPHLAGVMLDCLLGRSQVPAQFAINRFPGFQS